MSWIAEYDTHGREFPTCVHVTKTTGTMVHGLTYVPIQDGEEVRAENAKLRELVRILYYCHLPWHDCDKCAMNGADMHIKISDVEFCDGMYDRLRELGVEL